jgi:exonuclease III
LRIALWNANGLPNHNEELKLFLTQNKIDIMLFSGTHSTSKSHFSIIGYNICLANHPDDKAHGGTAILIKSKIAYAEQLCYAKPELQATIIQVQGPHRNIKISSKYCPPRHNLNPLTLNPSEPSVRAS